MAAAVASWEAAWGARAPGACAVRDLKDLRRLEHEELQERAKLAEREAAALRRAERLEQLRQLWPRLVAFWEAVARHLKTAAIVAGSAVTVVGSTVALSKYASSGWHLARRAWSFYAHRHDVAPAVQPPRDGERLAPDRVKKPLGRS